MKIRKLYRIESAHIVRKAYSQRCSHSYHGHSGVVEVFFKSKNLDRAGMVVDFGALKDVVGSFIDMFDHSVHLWKEDDKENLEFFKRNNQRYIILPCNPTAENYAVLFRDCINELLDHLHLYEGLDNIYCSGVRYHETSTGYAESDEGDLVMYNISDIEFSEQTLAEASNRIQIYVERCKNDKKEN